MRVRQVREQCLHVNVTSGVVSEAARAFILCLLSFRASLLSSSNSLTALKIIWCQAQRSVAIAIVVDMTCGERLFEAVFAPFFRGSALSVAGGEYALQGNL